MKDVNRLAIRPCTGGAVVPVKAVPGSSRSRVVGVLGEALKIAVSAAPEKGKANRAISSVLAEALGLQERDVQLLSGPTGPRKEFLVTGLTPEQVLDRLRAL